MYSDYVCLDVYHYEVSLHWEWLSLRLGLIQVHLFFYTSNSDCSSNIPSQP